ncbi:MAG: DUF1801 domain-containing protein [Treponema sp.]|nr:DUF1801 domain-containing protein [Treponema sp.]
MQNIRKTIRKAAPGAVEKIAWGMPHFSPEREPGAFCRFQKPHRLLPRRGRGRGA